MGNVAQEFGKQVSYEERFENAKMSFDSCNLHLVDYFNDDEAKAETDKLVRTVGSISNLDGGITRIVGVPIALDTNTYERKLGENTIEITSVKLIVAYPLPDKETVIDGIVHPIPGNVVTKTLRGNYSIKSADKVQALHDMSPMDILEVKYKTLPASYSPTLGKNVQNTEIVSFEILDHSIFEGSNSTIGQSNSFVEDFVEG